MMISRGNPRSSSVGETKDVRRVSYRSTSKLDPDTIVDVTECGIPLNCDSPGDSFGAGDDCANLDLSIYNVMGQEDKYRQEDGERVQRGGIARIIFTAVDDVVIDSIEYDSNMADEDNPVFNDQWMPSVDPQERHEVFVNVNPDSLYAFRVTISKPECPGSNTSGIYYFTTGSEIVFEPEPQNNAISFVEILIIDEDPTLITNSFSTSVGEGDLYGPLQITLDPSTSSFSFSSLDQTVTLTTSFQVT